MAKCHNSSSHCHHVKGPSAWTPSPLGRVPEVHPNLADYLKSSTKSSSGLNQRSSSANQNCQTLPRAIQFGKSGEDGADLKDADQDRKSVKSAKSLRSSRVNFELPESPKQEGNESTLQKDGPETGCKRDLDSQREMTEEITRNDEMTKVEKFKKLCHVELPPYPCHGVIGSDKSEYERIVQNVKNSCVKEQNADRETLDLTGREFTEGLQTSDIYKVEENLPNRFNNPEWFRGYGCENPNHPFYLTTNMEYGRFPPTAHTMSTTYWPKSAKFSEALARTGMPRNRSLNLMTTKSYI